QNIRLFQNLSAVENVMIGRHVRTKAGVFGAVFRDKRTLAEEAAIEKRAYELLDYVGVAKRANDLAKHLAYGDQRRLEIARALATEPKLLALDEPAAGMNATETQALKRLLEDIRRDGITILLIEHDMKLVMSVCDRVLVLDYAQGQHRPATDQVRKDPLRRRGHYGQARVPARPERLVDGARRPRSFRRAYDRGKPRDGRLRSRRPSGDQG